MEFSEVVRRRRMVRHYSGRPLSPEVVERVLTSALRAPSAGFSQGWAFWRSPTQRTGPASGRLCRPGWSRPRPGRTRPWLLSPSPTRPRTLDRYAQPDKPWPDRAEAHWPAPYWYIDTGMAAAAG